MMVNKRWVTKFATLLLFFMGCGTSMFSNAMFGKGDKYDWIATESAPKNYPMKIISGNLRYHNNKDDRGLYVPSGPIVHPGWGNGRSTHVTGDDFKELPDQLSITYFSYTENTFYKGKFDLPYDRILKMFKAGTRDDENPNYCHYVTVGVAPGGAVSVWVGGFNKQVEVFHGQAEKTGMDLAKVINLPIGDRIEYVKMILKTSLEPAALEALQKNGIPFGAWTKYTLRYNWVPVITNILPERGRFTYFNGEFDSPEAPFDKDFLAATRAVPKYLSISASVTIDGVMTRKGFKINFDAEEVVEVFAKLGSNQEALQLVIDTKFPKTLTQIQLRNSKEAITLTKWKLE